MSHVALRAAAREDVPAILAIYNDAVLNTTASFDYEPRPLETQIAWFDEHTAKHLPVFVAEDETGRLVGWSSLSHFRPRPGYRFTAENSVYVAADRRGQGIGKLLMPPLIRAAREGGFRTLIAVVDTTNAASLRLHESFGFQRAGHFKNVGYKFDRWLDLVFLQLELF
jgi:phosphinothricin acetyltransferase